MRLRAPRLGTQPLGNLFNRSHITPAGTSQAISKLSDHEIGIGEITGPAVRVNFSQVFDELDHDADG